MPQLKTSIKSSMNMDKSFFKLIADKVKNQEYQAERDKTGRRDAILTYMESATFATILEDTILKMRVLVDANSAATINKILIDIEIHKRNKYGVILPPVDENDTVIDRDINCEEFKVYKMDNDRTMFTDVMSNTYLDLAVRRNYKSLIAKNQEISGRKKYSANLKTEEVKNKVVLKELQRHLRRLRNQNKAAIYEAERTTDKLAKSLEDDEIKAETQGRHVDSWERARTEQHIKKVNMADNLYGDSIQYYRNRSESEQIVHTEIGTLVNIVINETVNEIQVWMAKYERDMESIDLKIQIKRNEYNEMLEKRIHIETTIRDHNKSMWDWNEFKRKRAEEQKYINDMTRSAIIVQAWWRGLLVRKQLGEFRVKKKKGGKKGK